MSTQSKTSRAFKRAKRNWQLYVIVALPVIWLLIFKYGPMYGVQLAFKNFQIRDGIWGSPWIGWDNFKRFFEFKEFWMLIKNTLGISIYQLLAGFPIPIVLALALNATLNLKFKKTVQFVTYMPYFISVVVLVGMVLSFTNTRTGIFNTLLGKVGVSPVHFMGKPEWFKSIYVWSGIWQHMGYNSIIYIAALAGIDMDIHEAAVIDGASRFQRVRFIDFPGILPTVITLLILNSGSIMSVGFEKVWLMQSTLNRTTSEIISTYVYKISLASNAPQFAYATAIGLFNSVINMILLLSVNNIAKKVSETSLW